MTDKTIFTVQETKLVTDDTMLLLLKPNSPFVYEVGDYLMLGLDEEEFKPYSIASAPREDGLIELHIRNQADTPFMEKLFEVKVGQELFITGPNKQYQLDEVLPAEIILIAGGTGFAPMKALLDELLANKVSSKIYFYWGVSKQQDCYLSNEMKSLVASTGNLHYSEVLSSEGLVHEKVLADFENLANARVYLCGPWDMVTTAKKEFVQEGLLEENYN